MIDICKVCVVLYVQKLMELERVIPDWYELTNTELLLAIGEKLNEENLRHLVLAREEL